MNNFSLVSALVFEPRKAFAEIGERPKYMFPLLLLVLATAGLTFWYMNFVDMQWLVDSQIRNSPFAKQLTEEQVAKAVQSAASGGSVRAVFNTVIVGIGVVIMQLVGALYCLLAGKITNVQRSFRQWFALGAWTSLPTVLAVIPAAITLLTASTRQLDQGALQPLSLNALFFQRAAGESGYLLYSSINLLQLLALYLFILGVRAWSGRSWLFSTVFALLPLAVVAGIVAIFTAGR